LPTDVERVVGRPLHASVRLNLAGSSGVPTRRRPVVEPFREQGVTERRGTQRVPLVDEAAEADDAVAHPATRLAVVDAESPYIVWPLESVGHAKHLA